MKSVQSQFPQATGMPVVQIEAGKIVVDSFVYAFIFSFFCNILIFINNFSKNLLCIAMHRFFANRAYFANFFNDNF